MTMDDYNDVNRQLNSAANEEAALRIGVTTRDDLGDNLMVTIWAAGI